MADVFSKKKRSEIMSRVKGKGNRATELRLVKLLRQKRIRGWRRGLPLFGRPDLVFPLHRVAIFVDGCFWHGCPRHGEFPVNNKIFWKKKLENNRARDLFVNRVLKSRGWRVMRIWQHEFRQAERVTNRVLRALQIPD